jgi:hypothetical protein
MKTVSNAYPTGSFITKFGWFNDYGLDFTLQGLLKFIFKLLLCTIMFIDFSDDNIIIPSITESKIAKLMNQFITLVLASKDHMKNGFLQFG